jgi:transposase
MWNFMAYEEISDRCWNRVEPLLEKYKRTKSGGSRPLDFRAILNGIFYLLKTGCQWQYIPRCYGSKSTIHEHFQKWVAAGIFSEIFCLSVEDYDELKGIAWEWQSYGRLPGTSAGSRPEALPSRRRAGKKPSWSFRTIS